MKFIFPFLFLPMFVFSQEIQSDRPNETESPSVIKPLHLQIESGIGFENDNDDMTFEEPELVLRYGIFHNTEFRIETDYVIPVKASNHSGLMPMVAGVKYHALDHKKLRPDIAVMGRLSFPWLATSGYTENFYSPEVRILFQHELSKSFHIGYNLGSKWSADDSKCHYLYTISADHLLTKKLKVFIETYGDALEHYHSQNTADAGFLFQLNTNMQFDIVCGTLLSSHGHDQFAGFGLSYRI